LEEVGDEHLDVVTGLGRQRWAACRGVTARVHGGIRDALEELVHGDAAPVMLDAGGCQIEVVDLWHPTGAVDDQVGLEPTLRPALPGAYDETIAVDIDAADLGAHLDA